MDVRNQQPRSAKKADGRVAPAVRIPAPRQQPPTARNHDLPTPSPSPPDSKAFAHAGGRDGGGSSMRDYVEVWDYTGDARFRGFVGESDDSEDRALFVFFEKEVMGKDLKPGLMALLELATSPAFDCSQLIVSLDRTAAAPDLQDLSRQLNWVGFELTTLDPWSGGGGNAGRSVISDRWLFMGMDV